MPFSWIAEYAKLIGEFSLDIKVHEPAPNYAL